MTLLMVIYGNLWMIKLAAREAEMERGVNWKNKKSTFYGNYPGTAESVDNSSWGFWV